MYFTDVHYSHLTASLWHIHPVAVRDWQRDATDHLIAPYALGLTLIANNEVNLQDCLGLNVEG